MKEKIINSEKTKDLVSAIIPVYNGEKFLAEAIDSVLTQDFNSIEIIVVDDGSTDNSAAISKDIPEVLYAYQSNQGTAAALNHGVKLARGDFYAFLDADDIWLSGKLSSQMEFLINNPETDMVFGHHRRFYSYPIGKTDQNSKEMISKPLTAYMKQNALIRREAFWRVGLFDTCFELGDFIDWFSRAIDLGITYAMIPQVASMRRIHGGNTTILKKDKYSDYVHLVKKIIDRRRQAE
mgnify:CR=1 FL=1